MSNSKGNGIANISKSLIVTVFKVIALAISFMCKLVGLLITKIGELFEKLSGHGSH